MKNTTAQRPIVLITGVMAAGKSSVAQALAERLPMSIHLRGDFYRRMGVNGRVEMSAEPDAEAYRQLLLRYEAAAQTARLYHDAGFNVVYQDVVIGPVLTDVVAMYEGYPLQVVVLDPDAHTIAQREASRSKSGYGKLSIEQLQDIFSQTPATGLRLDNSKQTVEQTVDDILSRLQR